MNTSKKKKKKKSPELKHLTFFSTGIGRYINAPDRVRLSIASG